MLEVLFILLVFAGQSGVYILVFNRVLMDATAGRFRTFVIVVLAPLVLIVLPTAGVIAFSLSGGLAGVMRFRGPAGAAWLAGAYVAAVVVGAARFLWVSLVSQPRRPRPAMVTAERRSVCRYRPDNREQARRLVPWVFRPLDRWNQRFDLEINDFDLSPPGLPEAFDGFSIVHLSDLHVSHHEPPGWHDFVLAQVERLRPDLIVVSGDYFLRTEALPRVERILSRLRAPEGVWAIRGNHDIWEAPEAAREILERAGVTDLANRRAAIRRGHAAIEIVGLEAPWDGARDWRALFSSSRSTSNPGQPFAVVLTHTPDNAVRVAPLGGSLMVAGHTHGGQIRLPLVGSLVVPSRYGKWFDQGWFAVGSLALYVNKGVGAHEPPLRLACRPEIARFILRAAAPARPTRRTRV